MKLRHVAMLGALLVGGFAGLELDAYLRCAGRHAGETDNQPRGKRGADANGPDPAVERHCRFRHGRFAFMSIRAANSCTSFIP